VSGDVREFQVGEVGASKQHRVQLAVIDGQLRDGLRGKFPSIDILGQQRSEPDVERRIDDVGIVGMPLR
jgi:hypothetical protein